MQKIMVLARRFRKTVTVLADLFFASLAYLITALCLAPSYKFEIPFFTRLIPYLLLLLAVGALSALSLYRRIIWRYAQVAEYLYCAATVFISIGVYALIDFAVGNLMHRTAAFYIVLFAFTLIFILTARMLYRVNSIQQLLNQVKDRKRALVVGAGEAAMMLIEEAHENPEYGYVPVALADDDPKKLGRHLAGLTISGTTRDIPEIARRYRAEIILVAIPSIGNEKRAEILDICASLGLPVKMLPRVSELKKGEKFVRVLREITPGELLGREEVKLCDETVLSFLKDKRVLVTGGGGSIGSELCRQIAASGVKKLIIFDIYENNAYEIEQELRRTYGSSLDLEVRIGSVRDFARLTQLFDEFKPQLVFHAAAHKHVPLMEFSPQEAVKNNVFGTLNTTRAAIRFRAEKFILISTDKAVNPTNVMGATKRLCEMIVQSLAGRSETQFAAVRFGNVLGSNGSVIPLFKKQIAEGGPITVTDPEIIRYFMTIPEAAQLVLTAGAMAKGGEIFVLDMGKPVKIVDLARKMIQLSGLQEGRDIEIRFTGLRPGEKLYEELLMSEEGMKKTDNAKIFIGHPIHIEEEKFAKDLSDLSHLVHATEQPPRRAVAELLARAVDTYHPKLTEFE